MKYWSSHLWLTPFYLAVLWHLEIGAVNADARVRTALVYLASNSSDAIMVSARNTECVGCPFDRIALLDPSQANTSNASHLFATDYSSYTFQIINTKQTKAQPLSYCADLTLAFGEEGTYSLLITVDAWNRSIAACHLSTLEEPIHKYLPLIVAGGCLAGLFVAFILFKVCKKYAYYAV